MRWGQDTGPESGILLENAREVRTVHISSTRERETEGGREWRGRGRKGVSDREGEREEGKGGEKGREGAEGGERWRLFLLTLSYPRTCVLHSSCHSSPGSLTFNTLEGGKTQTPPTGTPPWMSPQAFRDLVTPCLFSSHPCGYC